MDIVNNHIRDDTPGNWLLDRACGSNWQFCWCVLCCITCPMIYIVYEQEMIAWAQAVLAGLEEFKQKYPDAPFEVDFSQGRGDNALLHSEWITVNSIDEYQVDCCLGCSCTGNGLESVLLIKTKEGREGEMGQLGMGGFGMMMRGVPPPSNVNLQTGGSPMQMTEGQIRTFCGNCGTKNESMTKFCGSCGASMSF